MTVVFPIAYGFLTNLDSSFFNLDSYDGNNSRVSTTKTSLLTCSFLAFWACAESYSNKWGVHEPSFFASIVIIT